MNYRRFLNDVRESVRTGSDAALKSEKAESVALWQEIVDIAEGFDDNLRDKEYIVTTAKYGYYLYAIIEKIYSICISKLKGDSDYLAHQAEYQELWTKWQKLHDEHDCCPSLYIKEDEPMDLIGYGGNVGFDCVLRDIDN